MIRPLVIYHGGSCYDGFCAAWVLWRAFPEAEYVPAQYGEPVPDVDGRDVFVVDFSYKRPEMLDAIRRAETVTILDHHKTAQAELDGIVREANDTFGKTPNVIFKMDRSGGRLAWEWLHGAAASPWLVDYTEDRDLWRWALPESQAVNAALRSYPLDFARWNQLAERDPMALAVEGTAIVRREQQLVDQHVRHAKVTNIGGFAVPCVNATVLQSEIAGKLAESAPFGACYFDRQDGYRVYSLRSRGDAGIDVSEVAKAYGGGGHRNAAGFQVPKSLC